MRERMRSQHMLALYRSGRQADALGSYQEARARLVDELGIEPGPVLHQLELAILRHDPSLELAGTTRPDRAVLVVALAEGDVEPLLALAEPLARKPMREVIVADLVRSDAELATANDLLRTTQEELAPAGRSLGPRASRRGVRRRMRSGWRRSRRLTFSCSRAVGRRSRIQ